MIKIAICQMRSSEDPFLNLLVVNDFVLAAQARGAEVVFFPENVFYRGPRESADFSREQIHLQLTEEGALIEDTDFSKALGEFLKEWKIPVSLGSVFEKTVYSKKPFNSHFCFEPHSRTFVSYRKIHLFDYDSPTGTRYRESEEVERGDSEKTVKVGRAHVGLSICYDLRFPELFRYLALRKNVQVLSVPAAFTRETGKDHWHALLRARAIENQVFVVAAAQWGSHKNSAGNELYCFGNSCVYSPWGELVYCCEDEADHLEVIDLDLELVEKTRARLPAIHGAKFFHSKVSS